jgi:glutaredoxin
MTFPIHIPGKQDRGDILLYSLSTCPKCKSVKTLLNEIGVEYQYIDVDLLEHDEKEKIKEAMIKWHERIPFPMMIIDDKKCIIGDEPEEIRKALGL